MTMLNGCKTGVLAFVLLLLHRQPAADQAIRNAPQYQADSTVPKPVRKGKKKKVESRDSLALSSDKNAPAYIPYNQVRQPTSPSPAHRPLELPLGGEILKSIILKNIRN